MAIIGFIVLAVAVLYFCGDLIFNLLSAIFNIACGCFSGIFSCGCLILIVIAILILCQSI